MRRPERSSFPTLLVLIPSLLSLTACTDSEVATPAAPAVTPSAVRTPVTPPASQAMVVTANPLATEAGAAILRAGGSAVDAAVAIEATLSLVEPQSSGFGGGGFMTYYDAESRDVVIYDGREMAPAGADEDLFLDPDGKPYGYIEAKNSGLSIGTPSVVAMLAMAHEEEGTLPWKDLFDDAIRLADKGFDVSPRLASFFEKYGMRLIDSGSETGPRQAHEYFFDDAGELKSRLLNPAYADTLRAIRENPKALYEGDLAKEIVAAAQMEPRPGTLSLKDLEAYRPRKVEPLCVTYRSLDVCGPPPPASWVAVGMILGLLEAAPFPTGDRLTDWATFVEAQRLAYADRDHFVADDAFIDVPLQGMLAPAYLESRAALIDPEEAIDSATHGDPWAFDPGTATAQLGRDTTLDYAGTTHFVVMDHAGNVVSMTATVESIFGSARMAGGMFLNNQLTDFAKQPRDADGKLVANHPAAGKRPRSSMSPTIALDQDGNFRLATGSPGGNSIIAYTAKTLVGMLDWGLSPQEAINLPNVVARGDTVRVETERAQEGQIEALRERGFTVKESAGENSGLSIILRHPDGRLEGGVDPRREGTVIELR